MKRSRLKEQGWLGRWYVRRKRQAGFWLVAAVAMVLCLTGTSILAGLSGMEAADSLAVAAVNCEFASSQFSGGQSGSGKGAELLKQGGVCYERGQFETAHGLWQAAAISFQRAGDSTGELQSRLNQAQALKALGAYPRALEILENLNQEVPEKKPLLELKVQVLRSLGDTYQSIGEIGKARNALNRSLELAKAPLNSPADVSAAYLALGITDRAEISRISAQELEINSEYEYQEKVPSELKIQAQNQSPSCNSQEPLDYSTGALGEMAIAQRSLCNFQQAIDSLPPPTITLTAIQAELNQVSLLVSSLPRLNKFLSNALDFSALPFKDNSPLFFLKEFLNKSPLVTQLFPKIPSSTELVRPRLISLKNLKDRTVEFTNQLVLLLPQVGPHLDSLPPSQATVNARLHYAQTLIRLQSVLSSSEIINQQLQTQLQDIRASSQLPKRKLQRQKTKPAKLTKAPAPASLYLPDSTQAALQLAVRSSLQDAATSLKQAIIDAQALGNIRAEATARSTLAEIYGQLAKSTKSLDSDQAQKRWQELETLAQEGLALSQKSNAPDIAYRLQWQLALALKKQGKIKAARSACQITAKTLQSIRSDLVAIDQDTQFTFRDSVEPFYRECVEALLPSEAEDMQQQEVQSNLESARQFMESLQLAELDNFFRDSCLQGRRVKLDDFVNQENPHTAIIYPILVSRSQSAVKGKTSEPQKLAVIAKISNQEIGQSKQKNEQSSHEILRYHPVSVNFEIEPFLTELANQIKGESIQTQTNRPVIDRQTKSQTVYNWLIAPFQEELKKNKVDTLVFVLDGAFRNVPMAALLDGKGTYLIEQYAIALSPGLQLLAPKSLATQRINVLAAGLNQASPEAINRLPQKGTSFPPLTLAGEELKAIAKRFPTLQLLEEKFTVAALQRNINIAPYNVVHLSTHGKFSSRKGETYILAYDAPIGVDQLSQIFQNRERAGKGSIDLLVLSACETAKGDDRATLGLAGIAVKTGIGSTLAPLWSVNEVPTQQFMNTFYTALQSETAGSKTTKAKAVQQAQIALKKSNPDTKDWAAFVLVGNWS